MDENIKKVSYSQYSIWANCPWDWKLQYVDKLRPTDRSIELVFGDAIHQTIQWWLDIYYNDPKKAKTIDINPFFREKLKELFVAEIKEVNGKKEYICSQAILSEYYEDGCQILSHVQMHVKDFFPTKDFILIGCEIPLEYKISDTIEFRGYIDILIKDVKNNEYHIFDLKTSKAGWYYQKTDKKKTNQIILYKHFYSTIYKIDPDLIIPKFIILKRKIKENLEFPVRRISKFEPSHGKISMKRAVDEWDEFLSQCIDENGNYRTDVKPTPSKQACRFCKFKNTIHCTVGV